MSIGEFKMNLSVPEQRDLFAFFARVFGGEVDATFVDGLRGLGDDAPAELDEFLTRSKDLETSEVVRSLNADYARLFRSMSKNPVPPYESALVGELPLLMQEQRDRALAAYREFGYAVSEDGRSQEDHVALECGFCGLLCEIEQMAGGEEGEGARAREARRAFVANHLAQWAPVFAREVTAQEARHAKAGGHGLMFYSACAEMLVTFVDSLLDDEPAA